MAKRGRRKLAVSEQKNKIFGYLTDPKPKDVVKILLDDLISEVCTQSTKIITEIIDDLLTDVCQSDTKKPKHSGDQLTVETKREWEKKFPWLVIVEDSDLQTKLSCKICRSVKKECKLTSVWAEEGASSIQLSSIVRHNKSAEHKSACTKEEQNKNLLAINEENEPLVKVSCAKEDVVLFNTVYFCAKAELPSTQINGMLEMNKVNGLDIGYKNLSWDTIHEIQVTISNVLTTSVVQDIESSPYFSIMLDESTDIAVSKHLSICVRYIKS